MYLLQTCLGRHPHPHTNTIPFPVHYYISDNNNKTNNNSNFAIASRLVLVSVEFSAPELTTCISDREWEREKRKNWDFFVLVSPAAEKWIFETTQACSAREIKFFTDCRFHEILSTGAGTAAKPSQSKPEKKGTGTTKKKFSRTQAICKRLFERLNERAKYLRALLVTYLHFIFIFFTQPATVSSPKSCSCEAMK